MSFSKAVDSDTLRSIEERVRELCERDRMLKEANCTKVFCPIHGIVVAQSVPGVPAEETPCPICERERKEQEARRASVIAKPNAVTKKFREYVGAFLERGVSTQTFDSFVATTQNQKHVKNGCKRFSSRLLDRMLESKSKAMIGVILFGGYGRGKSHLASAIKNDLEAHGVKPIYVSASTLFMLLRPESGLNPVRLMTMLARLPVLIVDEIGRTSCSDFERNTLVEILDARRAEGLPTVFVTNLSGNAYEDALGLAVSSRTQATFFPFHCDWTDFRRNQSLKDANVNDVF